ncbi:MAG: hypothetical protein RR342_01565 [Bacilli bacterium]
MDSSAKKTLFTMISDTVNELPPEETFLMELKQTVQKENPPRKGSRYYKPSSMNCDRCMYYIAKETDPDDVLPSYSGVRITESGSTSHEKIQHYVSKMRERGYDCDWIDPEWYVKNKNLDYLVVTDKKEYETKFLDTRYNLSFLCDGIIRYRGKYYILEIKTETDYKNMNRREADEKHRNQSVCYSLSLKIDDIMWIYESRNICNPQTFHTHVTEKEREDIVMRIEYVDDCVKNNILPPKTTNDKACQYCSYRGKCSRSN